MTVHSLHIFDRKGKTLFTKTYSPTAAKQQRALEESFRAEEAKLNANTNANARDGSSAQGNGNDTNSNNAAIPSSDPLDEQRKLIFGMLFSLRELMGTLTPSASSESSSNSNSNTMNMNHKTSTLECVQTQSTKVHVYETLHGLRFAMYTSTDVPTSAASHKIGRRNSAGTNSASLSSSSSSNLNDIYGANIGSSSGGSVSGSGSGGAGGIGGEEKIFAKDALRHIYSKIWVECVIRSPMYSPSAGIAFGTQNGTQENKAFGVQSTNFEKELNAYLTSLPWFR